MAKNDVYLRDTGERMIPEFHKGALIYGEHLIRYMSAEKLIKNKTILDIASGSGYGSRLMAQHAKKVYGVDVDKDAVAYAQKHFSKSNIEYKVGDGESIPLEDNSVDVVVTFETIEHIKDYQQFIREVNRVLKPDGIAIVSTPNDLEFAEGNHFHLHEFKYDELYNMLKKDFAFIDSYYQATWKYVALGESKLFEKEGPIDVSTLNLAPLHPDQYLYFYLVCSNKKITEKLDPLAAISAHYSDRQEQQAYQARVGVEKTLTEVRAKNAELENALGEATSKVIALESELAEIKQSRAYKLALKAREAKRRLQG